MTDGDSIRVLVTGVGGGGHGEQIVKALRCARTPYWILGTDVLAMSSGFSLVDEAAVVPKAGHERYVDAILGLCERYRVQVVFHGSEPEMYALAAHRHEFRDNGIFLPINPDHVFEICRDKVRTAEFLERHGFAPPKAWRLTCPADIANVDRFPVVVKPATMGGGSVNVYIAQCAGELKVLAEHVLRHVSSLMVQEYVGTPDAEFTVGVLYGPDGAFINSIAVRRFVANALSVRLRVPNRCQRDDLGEHLVISSGISQGEVGRWPQVTAQCEEIAKALGPTAPINIQCRLVDGCVRVFEINPRFSGTTSLRAMMGYNEPDVLIRKYLLQQPVETGFAYREGTVMRGLAEYHSTPVMEPGR